MFLIYIEITAKNKINHDPKPFVDSLVPPNEVSDVVEKAEASVPDDILLSTALTAQDWQKAQAADSDINYVMSALLEGDHPSPEQAKSHKVDLGYYYCGTGKDIRSGMVSFTSQKPSMGKR